MGRIEVVFAAKKGSWRLPEVLSQKEVERLLYANDKLRNRCLLMTAYATGVRVSELVRLKVSDIDSERMMVRVEQGKGKKDRYTILSERLLLELRKYWKEHRSPMYLFPNAKGSPISINYAHRIYNLAKEKAEIQEGRGIHILRYCFATLQSTQRYLQIRQPKLVSTGSPLDLLRFPD